MRFAMNWSPQADALVRSGAIDIDLWKCADWSELVEPALKTKPVYVHFPLRAGNNSTPDWNAVRGWMEKTETHFVNMHLFVTTEDFPDIPFTSRSSEHRACVIEAMVRDVRRAGDVFGMDRIIVENLPIISDDDTNHRLYCSSEAETVRSVIEQTGCGLLLDIDHARGAASVLGMEPREYIESLPVDRICELHMTGIQEIDGVPTDHLSMQKEDWEYFNWAIDRFRSGAWRTPDIYAFEYGGIGEKFGWRCDPAVIAEQVPIFRKKIDLLNK